MRCSNWILRPFAVRRAIEAGRLGDRYPLFFLFLILLKVQRKRRRYREAHSGEANPEEQKSTNQKSTQKKK